MNNNNNNNYNKYLKYKKKYLELKGGANCPKIGFHQHIGECWHDAFMMVILYSDGIGEHIQKIFDQTSEYKFDINDLITYNITNTPPFLKPLNISEKDNDKFYTHSFNYIKNIFDRYENEKLSILPPKPPVPPKPEHLKNILIKKGGVRYRRDSINQSLSCNYSSFLLTNINSVQKNPYKDEQHGGLIIHDLINISVINYFLLNYFPKRLFFDIYEPNYIKLELFNFKKIFDYPEDEALLHKYFIPMIKEIIDNMEFMKYNVMKCVGIVVNISPNILSKHKKEKGKDKLGIIHTVSFISCGGKDYFYDNNGVEQKEGQEFSLDESEILVDKEMVNGEDDELKYYKPEYIKQDMYDKVMVEFNWREYLINKIDINIDKLYDILASKDVKRHSEFNDIILSFSECFYGHNPDKTKTIGNVSLKEFFISSLHFIVKKKLINEQDYFMNISKTILYNSVYSNKEAIEKVIKYFPIPDILSNVDGLLMLIDFAISNNNYNIIEYALENIRVNEEDTQFVKMNVIHTAIKNDDVEILKKLLKIIKFKDSVIYDFLADKAKQNNKLEYEKIIRESI